MYFFITDFIEPNIKLDRNENNQQAITSYFFLKKKEKFQVCGSNSATSIGFLVLLL